MGTNKERIEQLEAGLGGVQEGLHQIELGMADRLRHVEETLNCLSDVLLANQENPIHGHHHRDGHEGGRLVVSSKTAKLEFPRFSGDDPTEWFNRVNQFFEFQNTPEAQRVSLASYHLEGEANQWWQWIRRTFQEDGRKEFQRLGNRVRGWTQKALVGTFMGGLRTEISDGIRMFKPQTLKDAISFARMRDDQLTRQRRFTRPPPPVRAPLALPPVNRTTPITPAAPIRRLSWEEMQRKRLQGLCFNCNERFTAGHKCQGPRILMLEGHNGENGTCEAVNEEPLVEENQEGTIEPEITLHALTGWTAPKTMRVAARIGAHEVLTLIDSGSTHNFISERMASLLRLPVVPTEAFTVQVANGADLRCHGRFDEVPVNLQGITFSLTLYSLPLTGLDLVLGIQWLELLGSVVCNWKRLTMEFSWDNQTRRLIGIDGQNMQAASLKAISKGVRPGHTILAFCLPVTKADSEDLIHPSMQAVLQEYSDVFSEPSSLPPIRAVDHNIPLKEGTELVNVRPYRYAHYQK
ncbi:hypothetical protein I3760_16G012600 [Carya illinoinensis]|nr:hypothetical protein I3760_16G012600 [Carya illinoinensis]